MELLVQVFHNYGGWGLLAIVLAYIAVRGQITIRYPRPPKRKGNNQV